MDEDQSNPTNKDVSGSSPSASLFGSSLPKAFSGIALDDTSVGQMPAQRIGAYVVDCEIGKGSFATVFLAHHQDTGEAVAMKVVERKKLNKKLLGNLSLEISILKTIQHPNIVRLYDVYHSSRYVYLVMEYCSGGDLAHLLSMRRKEYRKSGQIASGPGLEEAVVQRFILHLGSALKCLRSHQLIHRDLKPQNLLLSVEPGHSVEAAALMSDAILKIADFGFARYVTTSSLADTLCGSPLYMAPEILRYEKYDAKADLWSVGTIMYEMLFGRPPFRAQNHLQLLHKIDNTPITDLLPMLSHGSASKEAVIAPHSLPASLARHRSGPSGQPPVPTLGSSCVDILQGLLRKNPIERTGFEEFFMHPFLRGPNPQSALQMRIPIPARRQKKTAWGDMSVQESTSIKVPPASMPSSPHGRAWGPSFSSGSKAVLRSSGKPSSGSSWQPPVLLDSIGSSIPEANTSETSQDAVASKAPQMPFASIHPSIGTLATTAPDQRHWLYYYGDERGLRRFRGKLTAFSDSVDKGDDFVVIEKHDVIPASTAQRSSHEPLDLDDQLVRSYGTSYPDTEFPLSNIARRISIPIPGYTRPRHSKPPPPPDSKEE